MSWFHRALRTVGDRTGKGGRQLGLQLDLISLVGPVEAWRRREHMALKAPAAPQWRGELYRELWTEAAEALGATTEDLSGGFLRISRHGRSTVVRHNLVPLDDPVTLGIAGTRPVAHALLERAGVPVVAHESLSWTEIDRARVFLQRHGRLVVKPAGPTGRGTGVTCGVETERALERAMLRAAGWDTQLVLEHHVTGDEYRLLVLDGEVIAAARRRPPHVVGDGRRSVGDLIVEENRRRTRARGGRGLWPIRIDLDCMLALGSQGLSLRSVPAPGTRIVVKTAVNENASVDNDAVQPVPGPFAAICEAVAGAVGARLLSVELITPDPGMDPGRAGGAVIEINTTPGFLYHAQVADPSTSVNAAVPILETLLQEGSVR